MTQPTQSQLPRELQELALRAESLAADPGLNEAFEAALGDPSLWRRAQTDPWGYLRDRQVSVPEGLAVQFVTPDAIGRPSPDHPFFTLRLTRCRTYWLRDAEGTGIEEVEACWGYEIVPHPLPPMAP